MTYLWSTYSIICYVAMLSLCVYSYRYNYTSNDIYNMYKQFKNKSYLITLYLYFSIIEFLSLRAPLPVIRILLLQTPVNVNYIIYNSKINKVSIPINRQDLIYRTVFLRQYLLKCTDSTLVTFNKYKIEEYKQLVDLFDNISTQEKFDMNIDYIDEFVCNYQYYKSEYKKIYRMYCNNEDNDDDNLILINKIKDIEIRINTDDQAYSMH